MKKTIFLLKILILYFYITLSYATGQQSYLNKGIELYKNKQFDQSKVLFERDLVFNPKSEKSYLYLAKIFNKNENKEEEEINLNNVLLLNPKNDEALYMLILIKIDQSDYKGVEKLIKQFSLVCNNFCSKEDEIKKKFNKLTP